MTTGVSTTRNATTDRKTWAATGWTNRAKGNANTKTTVHTSIEEARLCDHTGPPYTGVMAAAGRKPPSAAAALPAAHHPHILACAPGVPIPAPGHAIFAQMPDGDAGNRLVHTPLDAAVYYEESASLGQFLARNHSDEVEEISKLFNNDNHRIFDRVKDLINRVEDPPLPARFAPQVEAIGKRGEADIRALLVDPNLLFLGIMVPDNLTVRDRRHYANSGTIQITTCVAGVATVAVVPDRTRGQELAAFELFTPFKPAYWDMVHNRLVPDHKEDQTRIIGTITAVGVREVNVLLHGIGAR